MISLPSHERRNKVCMNFMQGRNFLLYSDKFARKTMSTFITKTLLLSAKTLTLTEHKIEQKLSNLSALAIRAANLHFNIFLLIFKSFQTALKIVYCYQGKKGHDLSRPKLKYTKTRRKSAILYFNFEAKTKFFDFSQLCSYFG